MKRVVLWLTAVALLWTLALPALGEEERLVDSTEAYLQALLDAREEAELWESTSFSFRVTQEVYDQLFTDEGEALLHAIEIEAGLAEVHYNSSGKIIRYRNCVFVDTLPQADNLEEIANILHHGALNGQKTVYIACEQPFLSYLTDSFWTELQTPDFAANCGIKSMSCTVGTYPVLEFRIIAVHTPYAMLNAYRTGDMSALTADEQRALETALSWAKEIAPGDDVSVMRQIHDMIIQRVTYDTDRLAAYTHRCTSALLEGRCVCSGYAETFFLLGQLCGLDVRLQFGTTSGRSEVLEDERLRSTHEWNMVWVEDAWRMVDVTWDDVEPPMTTYFNVPMSQLPDSHIFIYGPGHMPD